MNIILISVDSLRADFMEIAKEQGVELPNFERLFNTSYYFSEAVTQGTSSIQSHSSALSGLGPWTIGTGVHLHFPQPHHSIFYRLAEMGYRTISWHRGVVDLADRPDEKAMWDNQAGNNTCADEFINDICKWIKRPPKENYCAFLHFRYVHWPYGDCEGWHWGDERYEQAKDLILRLQRIGNIAEVKKLYTECLLRMDGKLGKLLDSLRGGELVILFGDHGDDFGEHKPDKQNFSITDAHVNSPWESVTNVPLFISMPHRKPLMINRRVRLLDIAPTIWNILEWPRVSAFEGFPLVHSNSKPCGLSYPSETWGDFYCSRESSETGKAWGRDYRIIKMNNFKFFMELYDGIYRTFDLDKDPGETQDITDKYPDVAQWLASFVHSPEWHDLNMYEQSKSGRLPRLIENQYKIIKEIDRKVEKQRYEN